MCSFVQVIAEVKKLDGTEFLPETLCDIIIAIQMFLESVGVHFKLLDDGILVDLKYTLDNLMKQHWQMVLVVMFDRPRL